MTGPATPSFPASLILLTYNQQDSVTVAVQAALAQQSDPIEIILSDDASADGTFGVLQKLVADYTGPHHVVVRRNETNLGINAHLECLVDCARSDLLIWAAGDDVSAPERAQKIIDGYEATGARLIFSDADTHTQSGVPGQELYKKALFYKTTDPFEAASSFALFLGATAATHKSLFKKYGPLPTARAHEDLILGFRAAMENSVHYVPEPLVSYEEEGGITGTHAGPQDRRVILQGQWTVLQQRLKDARTFGLAETDPVVGVLTKKLRWFGMRLRYYEPGFALSPADLRHPLQLAHALVSEWLRDRKNRKADVTDG